MSHTPGPWAISNDGKPLFGNFSIRQDPENWNGMGYQAIGTLPASTKGTPAGDMFAANARLIAAAPEIYEELKRIVFEFDGEAEDMSRAREIISKIEAS